MTKNFGLMGKQEAKSLKAQDIICRAAIACLCELGYAETSINRVVERAGVSKGALQHHFPTKEDLITTVADRLIQRSVERHNQFRMEAAKSSADDLGAYLRSMWADLINTKPYRAMLEILNAARTDRKLRERLSPRLLHWNTELDRHWGSIFEAAGGGENDVQLIMVMSRCLMRGLVIQGLFGDDTGQSEKVVERWIEMVAPLLRRRS
ncbi:TetR/AcrR family transcriptional regulator [Magnetospirillum sp. 15-1]|uniref:TetR/AcrR family transcriptional regulator n=1 Tax=Magnetospirillum sp. 15-1 TaxID=1979370 RepID=UPI00114114B3|nr:TetR/AcrR family transcriptional regulator [Magnetospirillum sp. 15-1]